MDTLLMISCANSTPGVHTIVPSNGTTLAFQYYDTADMESLPHFKALLLQTVAFGNVSLFGFPASGDKHGAFETFVRLMAGPSQINCVWSNPFCFDYLV